MLFNDAASPKIPSFVAQCPKTPLSCCDHLQIRARQEPHGRSAADTAPGKGIETKHFGENPEAVPIDPVELKLSDMTYETGRGQLKPWLAKLKGSP
jgi:hypothetical protein